MPATPASSPTTTPPAPTQAIPIAARLLSVSPSTYWREELFRIDQTLNSKGARLSFRYIHDAWDTSVLAPQWSYLGINQPALATFPTVQNRFFGPGTSLVLRLTQPITNTLLNDLVLSYVNSNITLTDQNGPGGAVFQRDKTIDQPLVADPSAPGQCNPTLSVDPVTGLPECGIGHIFNNGFGGKMPGVAFEGTNGAYGGRGFAADPSYMPWGHTSPTYFVRDDLGKTMGKHTLQFGAQYVYSQRNQTNNLIGAASGDRQGLLAFDNLAHSTGNAFADFLLESTLDTPHNPQGYIQSSRRIQPGTVLPAFSNRRTLFSGRLESNSQPDSELGLAHQFIWHLQREKPQCVELGGLEVRSE